MRCIHDGLPPCPTRHCRWCFLRHSPHHCCSHGVASSAAMRPDPRRQCRCRWFRLTRCCKIQDRSRAVVQHLRPEVRRKKCWDAYGSPCSLARKVELFKLKWSTRVCDNDKLSAPNFDFLACGHSCNLFMTWTLKMIYFAQKIGSDSTVSPAHGSNGIKQMSQTRTSGQSKSYFGKRQFSGA